MEPVSPAEGESGYFSSPSATLDPHLFEDGDPNKFRSDVRTTILNILYSFWSKHYKNPREWSTVWLAGSGISYQWAAGRGNGDLDVLIGIDYDEFWDHNPSFQGLSEGDLATTFNEEFHRLLWPATAHTDFHGQTYEVTFYVNPNSSDIRNIQPYAAYNLSDNSWTVKPPTIFDHPKEFYTAAENERSEATGLVWDYNDALDKAKSMVPGSPGWHNAMRQAEQYAAQAANLYDSIHLGRKQAFGPGGSGYGDWYNFRWQYHKKSGTAQALHAVASAHTEAVQAFNESVYGTKLEPAETLIRRAIMSGRRF